MTAYTAPIRDMRFVMEAIGELDDLRSLPGYDEVTAELVDAVLAEAARLCESVLHPINRVGDTEGCRYENGVVRTPAGFKEAYQQFAQGGWCGLAADPAFGGQGLPEIVDALVTEMLCASNLSFSMYPGLSHGAYKAILAYGSAEQQTTFLPRLVTGRWSGTMCLTEPQCGTDLGLISTRAVPRDDGTYAVSGSKIFISAGEHDLAENIIHLVLARTPEAPPGTKGLSLIVVPKFLPRPGGGDGELGMRNGVQCTGIEEKMGLHGSATCALSFDDATGYLVGEKHAGMEAIFVMMNGARLAVAIHGLGQAEVAYQNAAAYALEPQGRALDGPRSPDEPADRIVVHPDVRRMLMTMRAYVEGARAFGVWIARWLDRSTRHPGREARREADDMVALLTPVAKALFTDIGSEVANLAVQVFGGHGYIRDQGIEQFVRDARICQIYEGTNGIQAMDLVGRKLPAGGGRRPRRFFRILDGQTTELAGLAGMEPFVEPMKKPTGRLKEATLSLARTGRQEPTSAGAVASDYLRLFGMVALAHMWCRMAAHANGAGDRVGDELSGYDRAKLDTARYFFDHLVPQTGGLFASIMAGGSSTMALDEDAFQPG